MKILTLQQSALYQAMEQRFIRGKNPASIAHDICTHLFTGVMDKLHTPERIHTVIAGPNKKTGDIGFFLQHGSQVTVIDKTDTEFERLREEYAEHDGRLRLCTAAAATSISNTDLDADLIFTSFAERAFMGALFEYCRPGTRLVYQGSQLPIFETDHNMLWHLVHQPGFQLVNWWCLPQMVFDTGMLLPAPFLLIARKVSVE